MNAYDFEGLIGKGLLEDERFEDAAAMTNIVADARATALRELRARVNSEEVYKFALTVLCFLFDPVKNESFQLNIRQVRVAYRGIADSRDLQIGFARVLGKELLYAQSVEDALEKPFENLFQLEQVFEFEA